MLFLVSDSAEFSFPAEFRQSLADYLSHGVAREPSDLRSHVRRVFLAYSQDDAADLFAALADLFIALDGHGPSLRRRMLEHSKSRLGIGQYRRLKEAIDGSADRLRSDFIPGAVLCRGLIGKVALPQFEIKKFENVRDPLIEAREFLEYSQVEEARNLLEQAILHEPRREDLQEELLDIYW